MFYPVFLNLQEKFVVIIGGGEVAERKIDSLLNSGARIRLISPDITPRLRVLGESGAILVEERRYSPGDCRGAFLVISATSDPGAQQEIWKETQDLGILINSVDEPDLCNVIMPAVVRQGDLTVAISTGGKSPALASRLRQKLADLLGPEYGRLLELLGGIRPQIQERIRDMKKRKDLHYRIVDSDVLNLLKTNNHAAAEQRIHELIDEFDCENVGR